MTAVRKQANVPGGGKLPFLLDATLVPALAPVPGVSGDEATRFYFVPPYITCQRYPTNAMLEK